MTFSARQRLLDAKDIARAHLDTVSSEAFLRSAEAALVEMVMNAPDQTTPDEAVAAYNRIVGARNYLRALLAIAEPPKLPAAKPHYGLSRESTQG